MEHGINGQNVVTKANWRTNLASSGLNTLPTRHDAAGNLAFDGTYIYQYDFWGRLVQSNTGQMVAQLLESGAGGESVASAELGNLAAAEGAYVETGAAIVTAKEPLAPGL
jgi:hypothetical protein